MGLLGAALTLRDRHHVRLKDSPPVASAGAPAATALISFPAAKQGNFFRREGGALVCTEGQPSHIAWRK